MIRLINEELKHPNKKIDYFGINRSMSSANNSDLYFEGNPRKVDTSDVEKCLRKITYNIGSIQAINSRQNYYIDEGGTGRLNQFFKSSDPTTQYILDCARFEYNPFYLDGDEGDDCCSLYFDQFYTPAKLARKALIKYAGYNWTVWDVTRGVATLFAYFTDTAYKFDERGRNVYKNSSIRKYIRNTFIPRIESRGAKPLSTNLPDVGCSDKGFLPSMQEFKDKSPYYYSMSFWFRTPHGTNYVDCYDSRSYSYALPTEEKKLWVCIRVKLSDLEGNYEVIN